MPARLARAVQVAVAAAAQPLLVHVRPVMPAALAFRMLAGRDFHFRLAFVHARRRGQHQVLELIAETRKQRVVAAARAIVELGLQRGADLALDAQRFDALSDRIAQLAQPSHF